MLFDVDETLVHTGGSGARSWKAAFDKLYGIPADIGEHSSAGETAPQVARATFKAVLGRDPSDDELGRLYAQYLLHLADDIGVSEGYRVLPGAEKLLLRMGEAGVMLGLVSGAMEGAARTNGGEDVTERLGLADLAQRVAHDVVEQAVESSERRLVDRLPVPIGITREEHGVTMLRSYLDRPEDRARQKASRGPLVPWMSTSCAGSTRTGASSTSTGSTPEATPSTQSECVHQVLTARRAPTVSSRVDRRHSYSVRHEVAIGSLAPARLT